MEIGIVGLPNAGKSTLFNALLKKQAALVANYPFATIEPNVGVVGVPDDRLEKLAEVVANEGLPHASRPLSSSPLMRERTIAETGGDKKPPIVSATVKFVDIAGLIKGASQGEGLGNKFLSHIREVDAIVHVVRYFSDPDIIHVSGTPDPRSDIETVNTELILADLQTVENSKFKSQKSKLQFKTQNEALSKLEDGLNKGLFAKKINLSEEELEQIKPFQLLTMKPVFFVANVSEDQLHDSFDESTIPVCAKIEDELSSLSDDEQKEYLQSLGLQVSGLERIIAKGYEILNLISFLTAGEKEVRAWTIEKGTTAEFAAGVIHTDFIKHFIKAEVVAFEDFVQFAGWKGAREHGKARLEGRDYVMKDGDVVEFKIGK